MNIFKLVTSVTEWLKIQSRLQSRHYTGIKSRACSPIQVKVDRQAKDNSMQSAGLVRESFQTSAGNGR